MNTPLASVLLAVAVAIPCEASGRRAAFLGREDGSFEAWAYPLKILHDLRLSFGIAAYADPMSETSLASTVDIRPSRRTATSTPSGSRSSSFASASAPTAR
jgi:hypothetical protein